MLKGELIRSRLTTQGNQVRPRALPADYHWLQTAGELMALFRQHAGRSRGALAEALHDYEGDSLDYPVIRGLAAVLEARCTFGSDPPVAPEQLRATLFAGGPVTSKDNLLNPSTLSPQLSVLSPSPTRPQRIAETATAYNLTAGQVENALFADLAEEQIMLAAGEPINPGELIARYNLEVARGLLYWAHEVRLVVGDGYKDVFKYVKLFKLMHTVRPAGKAGYHVTLHGPISPFVKSTIRYGLQFARFMPALLLCRRWRMEADVQPPGFARPLRYTLDERTELRTHFKPSGEFDSQLEADFAAEFEAKYGGAERVWELAREDEVLVVGDTVMIPDFSLTHRRDGRRALIEIVGFWHPHYLRRKVTKVREAGRRNLILLVYESANVAEGTFEAVSAGEVLTFQRKPVLKEVLAAVERCAE
ncbi:MAG: DUF790 family protein [Chloroflexi bacterium]|nr:DUF790 family protein [Chloroflexota bacterium]MCI0580159.1 DUF790 family protein [Chloroflexota bacterium]MCI0647448.1 DUF790 family protein [Chloroflexota bacterium]MCI0729597.1 DUF790 family protein [Chloroflexota bacterium]